MKFYRNKWFWALVFFVILSVSWNSYNSFAGNNQLPIPEKQKVSEPQVLQITQDEMLPDTRSLMNEELQDNNSQDSQKIDITQPLEDKLNKVKSLQELQKKKSFMLIIAQDDLEGYSWGEKSQFPEIWKQAYLRYNLNGNQVMIALQYDVDTYLAYGTSEYALVWATADLFYEAYSSGKLKTSMTDQVYQQFVHNLNDVSSRLGIIYSKREYTPQFINQTQQLQQAPY